MKVLRVVELLFLLTKRLYFERLGSCGSLYVPMVPLYTLILALKPCIRLAFSLQMRSSGALLLRLG